MINDRPCYWKNAQRFDLSKYSKGKATSIYVSEKDVDVAGYIINSSSIQVACYWSNNELILLPAIDGNANSIFVYDGDVYIAGDTINMNNDRIPCYWKNGKRTDLSNERGSAKSIFVKAKE
jgi:hypothetical protein